MNDCLEISRLRKKRNLFAAVAIGSLAVSIAVALPRVLGRYAMHKQANSDLLRLQSEIVGLQGKIRVVQGEIVKVQAELNRPPAR